MWLGSGVAVALSGSYKSDLTPRLGASMYSKCGSKKTGGKIKNIAKPQA